LEKLVAGPLGSVRDSFAGSSGRVGENDDDLALRVGILEAQCKQSSKHFVMVEEFQKFALITAEALGRIVPADSIGAIVSSTVLSVVRPLDPEISSMLAAVCSSVDSLASRVKDVEDTVGRCNDMGILDGSFANPSGDDGIPYGSSRHSVFDAIQDPVLLDKAREALSKYDHCCLDILLPASVVRECSASSFFSGLSTHLPPSNSQDMDPESEREFLSYLKKMDPGVAHLYEENELPYGSSGGGLDPRLESRPSDCSDFSSCTSSSPHGY